MKSSTSKHTRNPILSRIEFTMECVRTLLLVSLFLIGTGGLQAAVVNSVGFEIEPSITTTLNSSVVSDSIEVAPCTMANCCADEPDCSIDCEISCSPCSPGAITSAWNLFSTTYTEHPPAIDYITTVDAPYNTLFRPPIV